MKNLHNSENKRKSQVSFKTEISNQSYFKSVHISFYGYMWAALTILGIDVFSRNQKQTYPHVIQIMKKYCFPCLFFSNFLHCFMTNWLESEIVDYGTIMDIILQINPVCLWISIFYQKPSIKTFIIKLSLLFKMPLRFRKNMKMAINIYLLVQFIYILLQSCLLWYNHSRHKESPYLTIFKYFTLLFHDNALSSVVTMLYCSNSFIFIRLLKNCKKTAKQLIIRPSSTVLNNLMTKYFEILKNIDDFQSTFSTFTFFCMMQSVFSLSFDILHWVADKKIGAVLMFQTVLFIFHSCGLISSLTICAGEIPGEMQCIKDILVSSDPEYLNCMKDAHFKTLVNLILRKRVIVLSACKIMTFDRSFILKTIGVLTAQTVIFYQFIT